MHAARACVVAQVAGLVPGAYAGRGKGNRFLADLCTADALLHVVDASGLTDQSGCPTERAYATESGGDAEVEDAASQKDATHERARESAAAPVAAGLPDGDSASADEIEWVGREIHLWVFTNVKLKLHSWRKRPERLAGMFVGYGCSPLLVEGVLRRAAAAAMAEARATAGAPGSSSTTTSCCNSGGGCESAVSAVTPLLGHGQGQPPSSAQEAAVTMARLASDSDAQLHRLVAHFVATRWPTAVALNKSDHPSSAARIAACRARFPQRALVPTSAKIELAALAASEKASKYLKAGDASSGVLLALSSCVALRPPTLCFPCANLQSLTPLTSTPLAPASVAGVPSSAPCAALAAPTAPGTSIPPAAEAPLRDCLLLRPMSTVGDAFSACKRLQLVSGDFVRAEGRAIADPQTATGPLARPVKKEDVLGPSCAILRLQATRKSQVAQPQRPQTSAVAGRASQQQCTPCPANCVYGLQLCACMQHTARV